MDSNDTEAIENLFRELSIEFLEEFREGVRQTAETIDAIIASRAENGRMD